MKNGLIIEKTQCAMGVIAIIFERRPNVTSDAASLAIKSGNVCVLRGGKEAYNSAKAIVNALKKGIKKAEDFFGLDNFNDLENSSLVHHVNKALRAHGIMKKDIDYYNYLRKIKFFLIFKKNRQ